MKSRDSFGKFERAAKERQCLLCKSGYYPRTSFQKYCSKECYSKSMKGQTHSWGYKISRALKGRKKSPEHNAKVAAALRIRKNRLCKVCNVSFYPSSGTQKYCSPSCWFNAHARSDKPLTCKKCGKKFPRRSSYIQSYCSRECQFKSLGEARKGKGNPGYRNGLATGNGRIYTGLHLRSCAKYRKAFLEKHDYLFCEVCGVNANGTPRFEVHHIYFASLYPKHPNLHDFRNLVMTCVQCHNNFHAGKRYRDEFLKLESERGLKELFSKGRHALLQTLAANAD